MMRDTIRKLYDALNREASLKSEASAEVIKYARETGALLVVAHREMPNFLASNDLLPREQCIALDDLDRLRWRDDPVLLHPDATREILDRVLRRLNYYAARQETLGMQVASLDRALTAANQELEKRRRGFWGRLWQRLY